MPSVFMLDGNDTSILELSPTPYDSERFLQNLLAQNPNILARTNEESERQSLLLIHRELGLPGRGEGKVRWYVDHLLLDQEGVPTFIEVKRSSNSELRREVVGQVLEYVANAVAIGRPDFIRESFRS